MTDLSLDTRRGLPDALQVLRTDYPREAWERHANFSGMVQFWLERHLMFRRLSEALHKDAQALIDRTMDPQSYRPRLARLGNLFLGQLHQHHHIEDDHYFPMIRPLDERLNKGFDLLDADHHALEAMMQGFAATANAALAPNLDDVSLRERTGELDAELAAMSAGLLRHLEDEEDLIVPVLLRHGAPGL